MAGMNDKRNFTGSPSTGGQGEAYYFKKSFTAQVNLTYFATKVSIIGKRSCLAFNQTFDPSGKVMVVLNHYGCLP